MSMAFWMDNLAGGLDLKCIFKREMLVNEVFILGLGQCVFVLMLL